MLFVSSENTLACVLVCTRVRACVQQYNIDVITVSPPFYPDMVLCTHVHRAVRITNVDVNRIKTACAVSYERSQRAPVDNTALSCCDSTWSCVGALCRARAHTPIPYL